MHDILTIIITIIIIFFPALTLTVHRVNKKIKILLMEINYIKFYMSMCALLGAMK